MKKLALALALTVGAGLAGSVPLIHKGHKPTKKHAPKKKKPAPAPTPDPAPAKQ